MKASIATVVMTPEIKIAKSLFLNIPNINCPFFVLAGIKYSFTYITLLFIYNLSPITGSTPLLPLNSIALLSW